MRLRGEVTDSGGSLAGTRRRCQPADEPLALLILDIDCFKRLNDHHGHPAGDARLRRFTAVLTASLRGPTDLAARLGGEEFTVLLPGEGADGAYAVAQRCIELLAEAENAHGDAPLGPRVTFSVGMAVGRSGMPTVALSCLGVTAAIRRCPLFGDEWRRRNFGLGSL